MTFVITVAPLYVFPEKWEKHIAQVPAGHGQLPDHSQPLHMLPDYKPESHLTEKNVAMGVSETR